MILQNRCLNCMTEKGDFEVCHNCGWIEGSPPVLSNQISPGAFLVGRYLVGTCLEFTDEEITYRAWDVKTNSQVFVREYFPTDFAIREEGSKRILIKRIEMQGEFKKRIKQIKQATQVLMRGNKSQYLVNFLNKFENNGTLYLVTEYFDSIPLTKYFELNQDALPRGISTHIIIQTCHSLNLLKQKRLSKFDINIRNILISKNLIIKLKIPIQVLISRKNNYYSTTRERFPGYVPPERLVKNGSSGVYSQIYVLGALLYRMTTGKQPEDATDRLFLDRLILPSSLCQNIEPSTESIILKCMEICPKHRYQSFEALVDDLVKNRLAKIVHRQIISQKRLLLFISSAMAILTIVIGILIIAINLRSI